MKTLHRNLLSISLCILIGSFSIAQEQIAVIQEPFVVLLDPTDGSIDDPAFIDLTPLNQGTPKDILQVNDEIWISDQIEDRIDRFDLSGTYISTISGGLDNIKGMELVNNTEVWVTNAGTNNGAPGDAIVRFDLTGNNLGFYSTGDDSSFDIIDTGTEVYVSYIGSGSRIERLDYNGAVLGNIVGTGVVTFIQQMEINTTDNTVYASVFSSNGSNVAGLYEFNIANGAIVNSWPEGSLRGVAQLANGNILISGGTNYGVKILDPSNGATTTLWTNSSQYFARVTLTPCSTPATPTGDSTQSFEEGATIEDIVVDPSTVTWFATENDALNSTNPLPTGTLLVDGETYWAVNIVDGCKSLPFPVTVSVCATPPTPTGESTQFLPEGSTLDDIVIDPADVTWFATENDALNNTNPLPNTTAVEDGVTYWAVSIDGLCLSTPFPVTIMFPLGVSEFARLGISVHPNPVADIIYIHSTPETSVETIKLFDIQGREIMEHSDTSSIDVSHLPSGVYILNIKANGTSVAGKILKE